MPLNPLILGVALALLPSAHASAQAGRDLVGTWSAVAAVTVSGEQQTQTFGENPKGTLIFTPDGRYSLIIMRADLPKFGSNNRTTGTPEENKAVVAGSIAHFGSYAVDGDKLVFHVEASTFPNWNGAQQVRTFALVGDLLSYQVLTASGGGTARLEWRRVR